LRLRIRVLPGRPGELDNGASNHRLQLSTKQNPPAISVRFFATEQVLYIVCRWTYPQNRPRLSNIEKSR
jgi:hypothetical protein